MKVPAGLLLIVAGCALGDTAATGEQESGVTQYVSIVDFSGIDQGAWYDGASRLNQAFSSSAEFPGITPLTFSCAVSSKRGDVHECAWTFASARHAVDAATAALAFDAATYQCRVHPRTTAKKLLAFLGGEADPLHDALPGGPALADGLADCFVNPIGATPLPAPSSGTTYIASDAYYTAAAYVARYASALAALKSAFDYICGDTFCSSDYGDLQSLDFTCAITKSSGNVKTCGWAFAGSFAGAAPDGSVAETSKTFVCPVAMTGTLSQLLDSVLAPGTSDDAVQRPLPGETTSAYDALGGCLP
ncbi:MAG TPA: hypothetical protein VMJ10_34775 [Kofleriaceae bacterium]|nr:hypothetical protein [Kofleriaceae bacterium]